MNRLPEKLEVLRKIHDEVVMAIIRVDSADEACRMAGAIIAGGITVLEISLTTPGALAAIDRLTAAGAGQSIIGAGTVLDATSARLAIAAGSRFIVCPTLSREVITMCNRYGVPVIPGIGSVNELVQAMEWGADVVKIFPGSLFGPAFITALEGPLPQARVIPVGGVSKSNMVEWISAGAFALGLGKGLTHADGTKADSVAAERQAAEISTMVAAERSRRQAP
jgi:2-dehydro-3-deoxyphosphogluconate aldolase/(4S)-4-hydroxy-2-oxoglutarate aldolase